MSPIMMQYAGGILVEQTDHGNRYVPQPSFTPPPEDPSEHIVVAPPVVTPDTNAIGAPLTAPIPNSVVDPDATTSVTEPSVTEPTVTEPTVTEPTVTEPTVTEPTVTEPTVEAAKTTTKTTKK